MSIRENEAELIVASTFDVPALSPSSFTSVTVPGILGKGVACKAWVINFDRQWSSPDKWREELNPIWRKVESLQEKSEAEVAGRGCLTDPILEENHSKNVLRAQLEFSPMHRDRAWPVVCQRTIEHLTDRLTRDSSPGSSMALYRAVSPESPLRWRRACTSRRLRTIR